MKVSSEWVSWCKRLGLRPYSTRFGSKSLEKRSRQSWIYLKGKGRVWRINCHSMFERGDKIEEFDRWALCKIESINVPTSFNEMKDFVEKVK